MVGWLVRFRGIWKNGSVKFSRISLHVKGRGVKDFLHIRFSSNTR